MKRTYIKILAILGAIAVILAGCENKYRLSGNVSVTNTCHSKNLSPPYRIELWVLSADSPQVRWGVHGQTDSSGDFSIDTRSTSTADHWILGRVLSMDGRYLCPDGCMDTAEGHADTCVDVNGHTAKYNMTEKGAIMIECRCKYE